jgi:hypothetical protein
MPAEFALNGIMRKPVVFFFAAVALLVVATGWQVVANEIASAELQDDMKDMSSELGARIGLIQPKTDDEVRDAVIGKALKYDIKLTRRQVKVGHVGAGTMRTLYLQADYSLPVVLPGYEYDMHFTPATDKKLRYWGSN